MNAAATIIRNTFQFAKILNQASGAQVQKWNEISVCNALNWADYFEQLFAHLHDEGIEQEFNSQTAQMTMILRPISCFSLSFGALEDAKMLLISTLISNPHLSTNLRSKLLSEVEKSSKSQSILQKVHNQESRLRQAENVYLNLCSSSVASTGGQGTNSSINIKFQAYFLLKNLIYTAGAAKKKIRLQTYCEGLCEKLSETEEGKLILVKALAFKAPKIGFQNEDVRWLGVIISYFISWLQKCLQGTAHTWPLLSVEPSELSMACNTQCQLLPVYLEALRIWANSFVPEVDNGPRGLTWRSPLRNDSQLLTAHYQSLLTALSSPDRQEDRSKVVQSIVDGVQVGGLTIWRSLASQLLQLLKQG